MNSISAEKFLKPSFFVTIFFGLQLIVWFLFFPAVPSVETGEPKELNLIPILIFLTAFIATVNGCLVGESTTRCSLAKDRPNESYTYYWIGVFFLYISIVASVTKLQPIISDPTLLFLLSESAGSNKIHIILSESSFGIASLQTLWIIPAIIFSFLLFSNEWKKCFFFRANIFLLFLLVIALAAINSARVALVNLVIIFITSYIYIKKPKFSLFKAFIFLLAFFFVYWLGSIYRDGLTYAENLNVSVFSLDVFFYIFSVFIEKYTLGEFNNALILMSYETQPGNFAYGTAFQRFFPSSSPDRYLNTLNIFGYWYWQFGFLGLVLIALVFGFALGKLFKKSVHPLCTSRLNHMKILYFMVYLGVFNGSRLNYYFLQLFFIPFFFFIFAFILLKIIKKI